MSDKQLDLRYSPVTAVDGHSHLVEAAWAALSVHTFQSLHDPMCKRKTAVSAAAVDHFSY